MSRKSSAPFVPTIDEDGYVGPALLKAGSVEIPVVVHLAGHLEPLDGRYHWFGRVQDKSTGLGQDVARMQGVALQIGEGPVVAAQLGERDAWGNLRIYGAGAPPFRLDPIGIDLRS